MVLGMKNDGPTGELLTIEQGLLLELHTRSRDLQYASTLEPQTTE